MTPVERTAAIAKVKRLLAALGTSAADVAAKLAAAGVTGRRGAEDDCPVYNYLRAEVPAVISVGEEVWIDFPPQGYRPHHALKTPPAVARFIDQFDGTAFPELVRAVR